jgi:hypothetical protein
MPNIYGVAFANFSGEKNGFAFAIQVNVDFPLMSYLTGCCPRPNKTWALLGLVH